MAPLPYKSVQLLASPTGVESSLPYATLHKREAIAMPSSSRAKIYRRRIRQNTRRLEHDVCRIRRQLRHLKTIQEVQRHLHRSHPHTRTRQRILSYVGKFLTNAKYLQGHDLHRHELEIRSVAVSGSPEAPVLRMRATLRGSLTRSAVDRLYAGVPGNSTLLDLLMNEPMVSPCSFTFFFSADGALEFETIETDYGSGFLHLTSNLCDVQALVTRLQPRQSTGLSSE